MKELLSRYKPVLDVKKQPQRHRRPSPYPTLFERIHRRTYRTVECFGEGWKILQRNVHPKLGCVLSDRKVPEHSQGVNIRVDEVLYRGGLQRLAPRLKGEDVPVRGGDLHWHRRGRRADAR